MIPYAIFSPYVIILYAIILYVTTQSNNSIHNYCTIRYDATRNILFIPYDQILRSSTSELREGDDYIQLTHAHTHTLTYSHTHTLTEDTNGDTKINTK